MGKHEKREDYTRPYETYDTSDLCAYARDILLVHGDRSGREGTVTTNWDSELANIYLTCSSPDQENPTFQMNVRDNRYIGNDRIYILNSQLPDIAIYDEDHERVANDTPLELSVQIMQYLRSNLFVADAQRPEAHIPEPRLSKLGEGMFQQFAAAIAIESAVDKKEIDMWSVAMAHNTPFGEALYQRAHKATLQQGIEVDNQLLPYTRSPYRIQEELGRRVYEINQRAEKRSLPPANVRPIQPDEA